MFEDSRKFKTETKDGKDWKKFNEEGREGVFRIESDKAPSFEESMFLDIVRSLRKDK
jgi:hypothetical protein